MDELARIELYDDGSARVVRLSGEIDISNAGDVERRVLELTKAAPFLLEMSGVSYLDSAGVRLLFRLASAVPEMRLALGGNSPVRRVLQVAAAEQLLRLEGVPRESDSRGQTGRAA